MGVVPNASHWQDTPRRRRAVVGRRAGIGAGLAERRHLEEGQPVQLPRARGLADGQRPAPRIGRAGRQVLAAAGRLQHQGVARHRHAPAERQRSGDLPQQLARQAGVPLVPARPEHREDRFARRRHARGAAGADEPADAPLPHGRLRGRLHPGARAAHRRAGQGEGRALHPQRHPASREPRRAARHRAGDEAGHRLVARGPERRTQRPRAEGEGQGRLGIRDRAVVPARRRL